MAPRKKSEVKMTELRVRITEPARDALAEMSLSVNRQGKLLTDLLMAAHDEYQRLQRDPNSPPGLGIAYVLRRALDEKRELTKEETQPDA